MSENKKKLPALRDNSDITVKQAIQSQLAHMGAHMMSGSDRMIRMRNKMETMMEVAYEEVDHKAFSTHVKSILDFEKHALNLTSTLLDDPDVKGITEEQKQDVIAEAWSEEEYFAALEEQDYLNVTQDLEEKDEQKCISEKEKARLRETIRKRQKADKKAPNPKRLFVAGGSETDKEEHQKATLRPLS